MSLPKMSLPRLWVNRRRLVFFSGVCMDGWDVTLVFFRRAKLSLSSFEGHRNVVHHHDLAQAFMGSSFCTTNIPLKTNSFTVYFAPWTHGSPSVLCFFRVVLSAIHAERAEFHDFITIYRLVIHMPVIILAKRYVAFIILIVHPIFFTSDIHFDPFNLSFT